MDNCHELVEKIKDQPFFLKDCMILIDALSVTRQWTEIIENAYLWQYFLDNQDKYMISNWSQPNQSFELAPVNNGISECLNNEGNFTREFLIPFKTSSIFHFYSISKTKCTSFQNKEQKTNQLGIRSLFYSIIIDTYLQKKLFYAAYDLFDGFFMNLNIVEVIPSTKNEGDESSKLFRKMRSSFSKTNLRNIIHGSSRYRKRPKSVLSEHAPDLNKFLDFLDSNKPITLDFWSLCIRYCSGHTSISKNLRWINSAGNFFINRLMSIFLNTQSIQELLASFEDFSSLYFDTFTWRQQFLMLEGFIYLGEICNVLKIPECYLIWISILNSISISHFIFYQENSMNFKVKNLNKNIKSQRSKFNLIRKLYSQSPKVDLPWKYVLFDGSLIEYSKELSTIATFTHKKILMNPFDNVLYIRLPTPLIRFILRYPTILDSFFAQKHIGREFLSALIKHLIFLGSNKSSPKLKTYDLDDIRNYIEWNYTRQEFLKTHDSSGIIALGTPLILPTNLTRTYYESHGLLSIFFKYSKNSHSNTDIKSRLEEHQNYLNSVIIGKNHTEISCILLQHLAMLDFDKNEYKVMQVEQVSEFLNFKDLLNNQASFPSKIWRKISQRRYYMGHYKNYIKRLIYLQSPKRPIMDFFNSKNQIRRFKLKNLQFPFRNLYLDHLSSLRNSIDLLALITLPYSYGMISLQSIDELDTNKLQKHIRYFGEKDQEIIFEDPYSNVATITAPQHLQALLENSIILGLSTQFSDILLNRFLERLAVLMFLGGNNLKSLTLLDQLQAKRMSKFASLNPSAQLEITVPGRMKMAPTKQNSPQETKKRNINSLGKFSDSFMAMLKQKLLINILERPYETIFDFIRLANEILIKYYRVPEDLKVSDLATQGAPTSENEKPYRLESTSVPNSLESLYSDENSDYKDPHFVSMIFARSFLIFGYSHLVLCRGYNNLTYSFEEYKNKNLNLYNFYQTQKHSNSHFKACFNVALNSFCKSIKFDPINYKSWFYTAYCAFIAHDIFLCKELCNKSLSLYRGSVSPWILLIICFSTIGTVKGLQKPSIIENSASFSQSNVKESVTSFIELDSISNVESLLNSHSYGITFPAPSILIPSKHPNYLKETPGNLLFSFQTLIFALQEHPNNIFLLVSLLKLIARIAPIFSTSLPHEDFFNFSFSIARSENDESIFSKATQFLGDKTKALNSCIEVMNNYYKTSQCFKSAFCHDDGNFNHKTINNSIDFELDSHLKNKDEKYPCAIPIIKALCESLIKFWRKKNEHLSTNWYTRFFLIYQLLENLDFSLIGTECMLHGDLTSNPIDSSCINNGRVTLPRLILIEMEIYAWIAICETLIYLGDSITTNTLLQYAKSYIELYTSMKKVISKTPLKVVNVSTADSDPVSMGIINEKIKIDHLAEYTYIKTLTDITISMDKYFSAHQQQGEFVSPKSHTYQQLIKQHLLELSLVSRRHPYLKKLKFLEARLLFSATRYQEAFSILKHFINIDMYLNGNTDPFTNSRCMLIYGHCLMKNGDKKSAILAFEKAISIFLTFPLLDIDSCPLIEI